MTTGTVNLKTFEHNSQFAPIARRPFKVKYSIKYKISIISTILIHHKISISKVIFSPQIAHMLARHNHFLSSSCCFASCTKFHASVLTPSLHQEISTLRANCTLLLQENLLHTFPLLCNTAEHTLCIFSFQKRAFATKSLKMNCFLNL